MGLATCGPITEGRTRFEGIETPASQLKSHRRNEKPKVGPDLRGLRLNALAAIVVASKF